jgi:hypothetical protein
MKGRPMKGAHCEVFVAISLQTHQAIWRARPELNRRPPA